MVNLYHNVSYQVWNDQNYQKLLKAQYHNKTKNKYFAEQGPPDLTNDVFPMKTLSQKRYWLTPHYYFRFMKDIKIAQITFPPVRIRVEEFGALFSGF